MSPRRIPRQLRIIGGRWRGRRLQFPEAIGLRPTGDRIRETLFNWLAPRLPGARCLDLFAGSGALGLEAASRGAAQVVLVERDRRALAALREHRQTLLADNLTLVAGDALAYLRAGAERPFDIVLVDPPFEPGLWPAVFEALASGGWLAAEAWVYVEMPCTRDLPPLPEGWRVQRQKRAGGVAFYLIQRIGPPEQAGSVGEGDSQR
jgi:16S rRNA (guanine966-N2)-methyltransferase